MKTVWWIAELLVVIGAINWGLVGIADFNLVQAILGSGAIARILYVLIGISGIWAIKLLISKKNRSERPVMSPEPQVQ